MEDFILLNDKKIIVGENIDYIQILKKHQRHLKKFEVGDLVFWLPKDPKIK